MTPPPYGGGVVGGSGPWRAIRLPRDGDVRPHGVAAVIPDRECLVPPIRQIGLQRVAVDFRRGAHTRHCLQLCVGRFQVLERRWVHGDLLGGQRLRKLRAGAGRPASASSAIRPSALSARLIALNQPRSRARSLTSSSRAIADITTLTPSASAATRTCSAVNPP